MPSSTPEPTAADRPASAKLDARPQSPRIQFSASAITACTLAGFVAFAEAGFLGYPGDPVYIRLLFGHTWLLFAWFCILILFFQTSLLLGPGRKPESLRYIYATTAISILLVGISVIYGPERIGRLLPPELAAVGGSPVLAAIAGGIYVLLSLYVLVNLLRTRTIGPLGRSLSVFWPAPALLAIAGAYIAAAYTVAYLHLQGSPQATAPSALPLGLLYAGLALLSGSTALLTTVASAALLVAANSTPDDMSSLLGTAIAFLTDILPTLAQILFLALAGFNALLLVTGVSGRTPFFEPSAVAVLGLLGAFLATAVKIVRNWHRAQAPATDS